MPNKKVRPAQKTEKDRLSEALFGPDEEIDEECSTEILDAYGITPSELVNEFKKRVEAEAQKLRVQGKSVPVPMQNALKNLRSVTANKSEAVEPSQHIDNLLAGTLPASKTAKNAMSFRGLKQGDKIVPEDQQILDSLEEELEDLKQQE